VNLPNTLGHDLIAQTALAWHTVAQAKKVRQAITKMCNVMACQVTVNKECSCL
jgi:uncharacterized membrane protein